MTRTTFFARVIGAGAVLASIAGCATPPAPTPTSDTRRGLVDSEINDSLTSAVNAQRELALTMDSQTQQNAMERRRLLSDKVSYDFYGDVEKIVSDIATKYGYDFRIYGTRPPEHVNVNVFVKNMSVIEVLKYVGMSSGQWLDIKLTPGTIELIYKARS